VPAADLVLHTPQATCNEKGHAAAIERSAGCRFTCKILKYMNKSTKTAWHIICGELKMNRMATTTQAFGAVQTGGPVA
jgi:hypothetical protein